MIARTAVETAEEYPTETATTPHRAPSFLGSVSGLSVLPDAAFMRTRDLNDVLGLSEGGAALLEHVAAVAAGGEDRVILSWPSAPESVAALHGLESLRRQTQGKTALTSAVFPLRPSSGVRTRSILVRREWVRQLALTRINAKPRISPSTALDAYDMMLLRLRDADQPNLVRQRGRPPKSDRRLKAAPAVEARHPSLSELFPIFHPDGDGAYQPADQALLERMRRCTMLGRSDFNPDAMAAKAMDRTEGPFRCFAIPGESAKRWIAALRQPCLARKPMDILFIDLTRRGRTALGVSWAAMLERFLNHVDQYLVQHPPRVLMITDSPFVARTAFDLLKGRTAAHRRGLEWPTARLVGVLARTNDLIGGNDTVPTGALPFQTTVVLRDATLAAFRNAALALARKAEEGGAEHRAFAMAVRRCYDFVRRAGGLPCGLRMAQRILLRDHAGRRDDIDSLDPRLRHRYFANEVLADLERQGREAPLLAEDARRFRGIVDGFLRTFETTSSLAPSILRTLNDLCAKATRSAIVLPSCEAVDFLCAALSITAEGRATLARADGNVTLCDRSGFHDLLQGAARSDSVLRRVVVVQPRPDDIHELLLMPDPCRIEVSLLGDAAGIGLVAAELATLTTMPGLERIQNRVRTLLTAIDDEQERIADLEFDASSVPPIPSSLVVDLTGDDNEDESNRYEGPVREICVDNGYRLRYRPASEVLRHTDDDNRPFIRVWASDIREGDRVLVMTPALMERMRARFLQSGEQSDMLALYHKLVVDARQRLPGADVSEKARALLNILIRDHAAHQAGGFTEEDFGNVRRWLSVDAGDGRIPRAPRHYRRYCAFMKALGVPEALVPQIWMLGIRYVRGAHISAGLIFNRRCVAFLIDPDTMTMKAGLDTDEVEALWSAILGCVATVTMTQTYTGSGAAVALPSPKRSRKASGDS